MLGRGADIGPKSRTAPAMGTNQSSRNTIIGSTRVASLAGR